jgi:hypothetical protein
VDINDGDLFTEAGVSSPVSMIPLLMALLYSLSNSPRANHMPALRELKINMWILATPITKTVTVVRKRQQMTRRVKGINTMPPPGDNIC